MGDEDLIITLPMETVEISLPKFLVEILDLIAEQNGSSRSHVAKQLIATSVFDIVELFKKELEEEDRQNHQNKERGIQNRTV